jgi:hypothetical protein
MSEELTVSDIRRACRAHGLEVSDSIVEDLLRSVRALMELCADLRTVEFVKMAPEDPLATDGRRGN